MTVENKKAYFNYEILEPFEAGIELIGSEVKSLRAGNASLEGAHVLIRGGEAFVVNMYIAPYQEKNMPEGYDPRRTRKLLITKKEIASLTTATHQKGLTIVPISVYNKSHRLKLKVALVRGKKKFDKRETLKRREADRDVQRSLKNQ